MKFLELFAGIGGFRRGLENLGHECVGFVEWDKFARRSYTAIWPEARDEWSAEDITEVRSDDIPGCDLWGFGFPCQDLSVAGRRLGFAGNRSSLFFTVMELLRGIPEGDRPEWLIAENVVGFLSSNNGWDFLVAQAAMAEVGYDVEYEIFNATDFGIPQNRERVFITGHLRSRGGRKVFPLRNDDAETPESLGKEVIYHYHSKDGSIREFGGVTPTLTGYMGTGGNNVPMVESGLYHSRGFETRKDGISHCVKGAEGGSSKNMVKIEQPKIIDDQGRTTKDLKLLDVVPTLRAQSHGNEPKIIQRSQSGVHSKDVCGTLRADASTTDITVQIIQRPRGNNEGGLHDVAPTVTSNSYQDNNHVVVSAVMNPDLGNKQQNGRRIKEPDEPMFTLTAQDKHGVMVIQKTHGATTTVNYDHTVTLQAARLDKVPCIPVVRNNGEWSERETVQCLDANYHKGIDNHGARTGIMLSKTIRTSGQGSYDGKHTWNIVPDGTRIRKLTPLECWRLMGREDWEHEAAKQAGVSDSQRYKQAGNSLIPQIVTAIARNME